MCLPCTLWWYSEKLPSIKWNLFGISPSGNFYGEKIDYLLDVVNGIDGVFRVEVREKTKSLISEIKKTSPSIQPHKVSRGVLALGRRSSPQIIFILDNSSENLEGACLFRQLTEIIENELQVMFP